MPKKNLQRLKRLSKLMSYILRHRPDEFGLVLDFEGWVSIKELLKAIREEEGWSHVRESTIHEVMISLDRERFEVKEGKIRALYGHSVPTKIEYPESEPPELLYHATRRRSYPVILQKGLLPMSRQYVHLATTPELAMRIGKRKDPYPVLLTVEAGRAYREGVNFYRAQELIYLADRVESRYITGPPLDDEILAEVRRAAEKKKEKEREKRREARKQASVPGLDSLRRAYGLPLGERGAKKSRRAGKKKGR